MHQADPLIKKSIIPNGIIVLSTVYLLSSVLYVASLFLFYNEVVIFGEPAAYQMSLIVKAFLIGFPIFLAARLLATKKDGYLAALCFHFFFIVNSVLMFFENSLTSVYPIFKMDGVFGSLKYTVPQMITISLNLVANIVIFAYLARVTYVNYRTRAWE